MTLANIPRQVPCALVILKQVAALPHELQNHSNDNYAKESAGDKPTPNRLESVWYRGVNKYPHYFEVRLKYLILQLFRV